MNRREWLPCQITLISGGGGGGGAGGGRSNASASQNTRHWRTPRAERTSGSGRGRNERVCDARTRRGSPRSAAAAESERDRHTAGPAVLSRAPPRAFRRSVRAVRRHQLLHGYPPPPQQKIDAHLLVPINRSGRRSTRGLVLHLTLRRAEYSL